MEGGGWRVHGELKHGPRILVPPLSCCCKVFIASPNGKIKAKIRNASKNVML